ncbi:MAG: FAD:protein FMN transferase, partial [Agathobacter sp.]|nr:FAD:protein FMN transferase [Agathobacter sp.]
GELWRVGIQNPDKESDNSYVLRVGLQDLSLVTSGDYQRYYEVDGVRYCHIIDPDTLMPANEFASVTILCPDSGVADALSTSLFCMSLEEGMELIQYLEGVEALWLYHDGRQVASEGFATYILE